MPHIWTLLTYLYWYFTSLWNLSSLVSCSHLTSRLIIKITLLLTLLLIENLFFKIDGVLSFYCYFALAFLPFKWFMRDYMCLSPNLTDFLNDWLIIGNWYYELTHELSQLSLVNEERSSLFMSIWFGGFTNTSLYDVVVRFRY